MVLRRFLYIGTALLMAGCSSDENFSDTLSGEGKTPLQIEATLSTGNAMTRAAGKDFAKDDQLLAYIRHITGDTKVNYTSVDVPTSRAPKLVTFTKGSAAMTTTSDNNVNETSDLTTVYWDDFSNSSSTDTDLRTDGHGLQSFYGYCYNGGSPSTELIAATGQLGWTVQTDQSTAANFQKSDLLWSPEQDKVTYAHASARTPANTHGILTIPYTHAMSEVTVSINAVAEEGFSSSAPLASTALTLYGMKTTATLTAPLGVLNSGESTNNLKMCGDTYSSGNTRKFSAIVAPGTKLKEGEKLLDITNVDGNDYTLTITSSMLTNDNWAKGHTSDQCGTEGEPAKSYVITQPGVNYHLTVTVKKTAIQTHATLAGWTTVNATGEGDIAFDDNEDDENLVMDDSEVNGRQNVKVVAVDENLFVNGASFSLFTLKSESTNNDAANRTNAVYNYATISTFEDKTNTGEGANHIYDKWNNRPEIYWPNKTDNYYFRALAKFNNSDGGKNDIESVGDQTQNEKKVLVSQGGDDILWGTTATHQGTYTNKTYERGQAIPPRTGGVPIAFEHAMSKVTFQLETASGTEGPNSPVVNLTDATIAISNLYTSGTITIENGIITYTDTDNLTENAIPAVAAPISERIVVPQTIRDNAIVTITLNDGTTYKLKLKECVVSGSTTPITQWERGKHYTYTIHIEKEQIQFRVLIKDWDGVTGSGNANLEWD